MYMTDFFHVFVVLCMSKCQVDGGKDATAELNQLETEVDDKYSHVSRWWIMSEKNDSSGLWRRP